MISIEINTINIKNLTVDSHQNFLILDDDPDINEVIVQYLEITGFNGKFLTAATILEAKKHLKQYSYRDVSAWLSEQSGRYISHVGLMKRVKIERKRKREASIQRHLAEKYKAALEKAEKLEKERLGGKDLKSTTGDTDRRVA